MNKKCKQYLPDKKGINPHLQRIAFMSTGGKTAKKMYEILKEAMMIYYQHDEQVMKQHVDWIWMTHVPVLGYGKSHGWTKIVRFLGLNLVEETIEALLQMDDHGGDESFEEEEKEEDSIMVPDGIIGGESRLSKAMRQVIRFHCRISHVAAHTAVFNVNVTYSLDHMVDVVEKVIVNPNRHVGGGTLDHLDRMDKVKSYLMEVLPSLIDTDPKRRTLSWLLKKPDMMDALQNTLQEELDTTNGLKKWPCQSFWDIHGIDMDDRLRKMASKLSPDCDAPFTTCVVARDRCEMNGHATC
jgi:hypothetical protein